MASVVSPTTPAVYHIHHSYLGAIHQRALYMSFDTCGSPITFQNFTCKKDEFCVLVEDCDISSSPVVPLTVKKLLCCIRALNVLVLALSN